MDSLTMDEELQRYLESIAEQTATAEESSRSQRTAGKIDEQVASLAADLEEDECSKRRKLDLDKKFFEAEAQRLKNKVELVHHWFTTDKVTREWTDLDIPSFILRLPVDARERESSSCAAWWLYGEGGDRQEDGPEHQLEKAAQAVSRAPRSSPRRRPSTSASCSRTSRSSSSTETFREDFLRNGPIVDGTNPRSAGGEELFALPLMDYLEFIQVQKEFKLTYQLFSLYVDVLGALNSCKQVLRSG
eukprot:gene33689-41560_t